MNYLDMAAAYSLLKAVGQANQQLWLLSYHLQKYDPVRETSLQIDGKEPTAEDLISLGDNEIGIVNHLSSISQNVLAKPLFMGHVNAGIDRWEARTIDVEADCSRNMSAKAYWDQQKTVDEGILFNLGDYCRSVPDAQLKPVSALPDAVRYLIIIHDLLDAMIYELRNINSANGQELGFKLDGIQRLVSRRIKTANNLKSRAYSMASTYEPELDAIYALVDYAAAQNPKNLNEAFNVSKYIESQIPRLPLWRRWWAH